MFLFELLGFDLGHSNDIGEVIRNGSPQCDPLCIELLEPITAGLIAGIRQAELRLVWVIEQANQFQAYRNSIPDAEWDC
ncbi:MAG: hypothetical protein JJU24_14060 [Natronohydrobacter sp.]|nr:hypothetical protein [Natronohydrobacter sp.]